MELEQTPLIVDDVEAVISVDRTFRMAFRHQEKNNRMLTHKNSSVATFVRLAP